MHRVPRGLWSQAAFLCLTAACAPLASDGDSALGVQSAKTAAQPIFQGVPSAGDHGVPSLIGGGFICSSTLVSSKVLLTAGHCVDGAPPRQAFFGQDRTKAGELIDVIASFPHPDYDEMDFSAFDAGIVVLAQRARGIEPHRVNATPMTEMADIGTTVRFVGFGARNDAVAGQRYTASAAISGVNSKVFTYGSAICQGDSGGPAFRRIEGKDVVVGITSFGQKLDCSAGPTGGSTRADRFATWVDQVVAEFDPVSCEQDFRCGSECTQADPDCPCKADDGFCSALCEDTDTDPDCPMGCGENGECVSGCPRSDLDCGPPCGLQEHCIEDCAARDPDCEPAIELGAVCAKDFDCGTGALCAASAEQQATICVARCTAGDDSTCDDGTCETIGVGRSVCKPSEEGGGGCRIATGGAARGGGLAWVALALMVLWMTRCGLQKVRAA